MKKRITALLLCCVMLLTLCPGLISTATAYDDTQPDQAEATGETVQPTVNFTNVAPFLPPVSGGVRMQRAASFAAANFAANDAANFAATDNGMKISKTATPNADGSYTITLEAYATGSKVITEQKTDIPTDIILVLDQSGSMAEDMSTYGFQEYTNRSNSYLYSRRHNGGNDNLYYQLDDGSYATVSVSRIRGENVYSYTKCDSDWNNREYYNYENDLYVKIGDGYQKVTLTRTGGIGNRVYTYTFPNGDSVVSNGAFTSPGNFEGNGPLYYRSETAGEYIYTYTYTDKGGVTQTIGTSTGADTQPTDFTLYERYSTGSVTRLSALKTAVTNFANSVAEKAAGKDGNITTTEDNINHRIALVGFSSPDYNNTELLTGSVINQGEWHGTNISTDGWNGYYYFPTGYEMNGPQYGSINDAQYKAALLPMNTDAGLSGVATGVNALTAWGGTRTDNGLAMANKILEQNPIPTGEQRNRVVIVFTDGIPGLTGYDSNVASNAITQASTAKNTYGATVYTIGIFSGADATSAGSTGNGSSDADKGNYFLQRLSSNTQYPQTPSYYLSAADADSLNSIFEQISDQIETGGSSSTLTAASVVKDIISPQFTLPAGTKAADITLETYKYKGTSFDATNAWEKNPNAMSATATVNGDTVSVTGFDFAENWCGSKTNADGSTTYQGNKLVISFKVQPKAGFLGGNDVYTNSSAGVYENGSATDPVLSFPRPQVNVPIDDVAVTAADKNVYLLGDLTAEQLKSGAEVKCGDVTLSLAPDATNYGLEAWQTEYVNITVTVKDKDGNVITTDLTDLTDDTTYTVEVTVAPKTQGTSTPEKGEAATAKTGVNAPAANIYVFKPEVNFKDSTIYRGNTADYNNNQTDTPVWKHRNNVATAVNMIGNAPTLTYTYDKEVDAFEKCTDVNVTVMIGNTNVTDKTTGDKQFTVHVLQPTITATINDVERYYGESYTLGVGANGAIDLTWTDKDNHSAIPPVTGNAPYTESDLSLAYSATAFSDQTGTVPASDFDVTVRVMKGDDVMPATITNKCNYGCGADQTDGKYTVHVKTCTLTVQKTGWDKKDADQSFIFNVTGGEIAQNIKVTVQENGSVTIVGLPVGSYTVTEVTSWSWRYNPDSQEKTVNVQGGPDNTVTFHNTRTAHKWLSGDNYAVNHVTGIKAQGTFVGSN